MRIKILNLAGAGRKGKSSPRGTWIIRSNMKIKQNTLSILLSLALVLTFIPAIPLDVFADNNNWIPWEEHEGDGYFEDGYLTWNIFSGAGGTDRCLDFEGKCRLYCYAEVYVCEETTTGPCWELVDEGVRKKYRWYKDDNIISDARGKDYVATEKGTYRCDVTVTCGGDKKTDSIIFNVVPFRKGNLSLNASDQVVKTGTYYKLRSASTRSYRFGYPNRDTTVYIHCKDSNGDWGWYDTPNQIEMKANKTYYLYSYENQDIKISISPVTDSTEARARVTRGLKAKPQKKGSVQLTWKKTRGAKGYQIYRSTKKNKGFRRVAVVKSVNTIKWIDKKSKKGRVYYYKVRSYNTVSGKTVTGKWSSIVKVKTK